MTEGGGGKTAVVLSGGGAYAAYEVGVMKALFSGRAPHARPLRADVFTGTSMGAVNAAAMVSRPAGDGRSAVQFLEDVWVNHLGGGRGGEGAVRLRWAPENYWGLGQWVGQPLRPLSWLLSDGLFFAREGLTRAAAFLAATGPPGRRALETLMPPTPIDKGNFERILARAIDLAGVRRSDRALRVTTTNWRTGRPHVFANQDLTDARGHLPLYASAAFPGVPPVVIEGEPFADGAYLLDQPMQPAVAAGAETLHVIYMDPDIKNIPLRRLDNMIDTLDKVYHIMVATIFARDIQLARVINLGLDALERGTGAFTDPQLRALLVLAGRRAQAPPGRAPFRRLTIHRYHPSEDLGGALGVLNFDRAHVQELIERGHQDAVAHDCQKGNCLLPA
jgi:predicted acylesterase/phospholipase RssA